MHNWTGFELMARGFVDAGCSALLVPRVRGDDVGLRGVVTLGWAGVRLGWWVLADNPLFAAVRWGVFLKEGNFLLGSDVFVTDRQSDAYAVDAIPRGIFDEDYLRWIGVEVSDRSFETSRDRRTLGSPDGGRSRMWRR